jgi:hypothetical protein
MRDFEQRIQLNSMETTTGTETYRLVISKEVPNICALTNSAIFVYDRLMVQEEKKKEDRRRCKWDWNYDGYQKDLGVAGIWPSSRAAIRIWSSMT